MHKKNKAAVLMGRAGGQATKSKHGKNYYKTIGKKGALIRWQKKDNELLSN